MSRKRVSEKLRDEESVKFRALADQLGLKDWDIQVKRHSCKKQYGATTRPMYGRKLAMINLSRRWASYPESQRLHFRVHELLHCHFDAVENIVWCGGLETVLDEVALGIVKANQRTAVEWAVDAIAAGIAPLLSV